MSLIPGSAGEIANDVQSHLAAAGLIPFGGRLTPLSGGRTNRLWRVGTPNGSLAVKLYTEGRDNPLFPNDPAAEVLLLKHLSGTGLAPKFHASIETPMGVILLYSHVDGKHLAHRHHHGGQSPGPSARHDPAPSAQSSETLQRKRRSRAAIP